MRIKYAVAVVGLAATAFALPVAAQMKMPNLSSAYIGGGLGQSKFKVDCSGLTSCDDKDTSLRFFGGYQFNRNIAAELGYGVLGKAKFSDPFGSAELKINAWDLSAVGSWPLANEFSVFGRLGLYLSDAKFSGGASGSKKSSGLTFGLGGQYDFNRNLGLRLEWQRYSKVKAQETGGTEEKGDVDILGVSVLWRFQ
jgi:OOP family OmpA-OmpF porin